MNKQSQISFVEFVLVFLLFGFLFTTLHYDTNLSEKDYKLTIDSFLDSIYYSENYRSLIIDEDLSKSTLTGNWTNFQAQLNKSFTNYEFIISNSSYSKKIYSCSAIYNKYYVERFISIKNNTKYDFRKIKLGVCY